MDTSLQEYFTSLSKLEGSCAIRVLNKSNQNATVIGILSKLGQAEEMYHSLEFLKPKRFRREGYILGLYASLIEDIHNQDNSYITRAKDSPSAISSYASKRTTSQQLFDSVKEVVKIRKCLIKGYKLLNYTNNVVPFDNWMSIIEDAELHFDYYHFHKVMVDFINVLKCEIKIIKNMILAHQAIINYDFKGAILSMHKAHQFYIDWKSIVDKNQCVKEEDNESNSQSSMLSFLSSITDIHFNSIKPRLKVSNLMQWLELFYDNIMAKLTLYFHEPLMDKELKLGGDGKSLWKNVVAIDYPLVIRNFKKRSGALNISIIYQVKKEQPFSKKGFLCHGMKYEPLTGLESYPFLYSYPEELPKEYKPALISLIMSNDQQIIKMNFKSELNSPSPSQTSFNNENNNTLSIPGVNALSNLMSVSGLNFSYSTPIVSPEKSNDDILGLNKDFKTIEMLPESINFYDMITNTTFFISKVDRNVNLAFIFLDKVNKKDNSIVEFLNELTSKLRLTTATAYLVKREG